MSSQVDIGNLALIMLGQPTIVSLADNNDRARALNAVYPTVRDSELTANYWKFNIFRTTLPALVSVPAAGPYTLQYQTPADFLKELEIGDRFAGTDNSDYRTSESGLDYSVEGGLILTNYPAPLALRYQARITDEGRYDACFVTSFAAMLADVTCFRITQSNERKAVARAERKEALIQAIRSNALYSPPRYNADDSWVTARIQ